eukprot:12927302-Prorocentrum_lima.AAC.1
MAVARRDTPRRATRPTRWWHNRGRVAVPISRSRPCIKSRCCFVAPCPRNRWPPTECCQPG